MANLPQNSGEPTLCVNNCGFFGNPASNNLCSKCYKDLVMKQAKELDNSEAPTMEKSEDGEIHQQVENQSVECGSSENPDNHQPSNRCSFCRKRVGLTGFKCRCEQTFCSMHRYSDKHNCVFDYKAAAQDAIARANPVVKADKVEKI